VKYKTVTSFIFQDTALYPSASSSCQGGQSKQSKDSFFLDYLDSEYRCGMWLSGAVCV